MYCFVCDVDNGSLGMRSEEWSGIVISGRVKFFIIGRNYLLINKIIWGVFIEFMVDGVLNEEEIVKVSGWVDCWLMMMMLFCCKIGIKYLLYNKGFFFFVYFVDCG